MYYYKKISFTLVEIGVLPRFHKQGNEGRHENLSLYPLVKLPLRGKVELVMGSIPKNNIFCIFKVHHFSPRLELIPKE